MLITTGCPQCGGEIEFLDEAQALKCRYCGSLLQLAGTRGVRHYYLAPRATETRLKEALVKGVFKKKGVRPRFEGSRLVFSPYWWVKGMVFKWIFGRRTIPSLSSAVPDTWKNIKELKTHLLDHTFSAAKPAGLGPPTLGVRTAALRVRFYNSEEMATWGVPLPTTVSYDEARAYAESLKGALLSLKEVSVDLERTRLIGERYAVVFFPVWVFSLGLGSEKTEVVVDGLSHKVLRVPHAGAHPALSSTSEGALGLKPEEVTFIPFRCPECGWDLPYRPLDVVHLCATCGRAWREERGTYRQVTYRVVKGSTPAPGTCIYLPFWVFQVSLRTSTETLTAMDQFRRYFPVAQLRARKPVPGQPIRFFVPAFRIKDIPAANKFSTLFTQTQPQNAYTENEALRNHRRAGVCLDVREAKEMAEVLLCSLIPVNSRKAKTFVQHATLTCADESLEWYPFLEQEIYLREQTTGHALQAGALDLG